MKAHEHSIENMHGWIVIAVSLVIHTIGMAAPTLLFVALKSIAADFGTARAVPSVAYALMMIGAGGGGIFMGLWMDRRGVFQPVAFGSLMIGLGAFTAGRADGPFELYVATGVLIGLCGKAAMIAPLIANVTRWFDRRRGLAVAIISSGQGFAGALWPPVVRYLNDAYGWRTTFALLALMSVCIMFPLSFLLRRPPPEPSHGLRAAAGHLAPTGVGMSPKIAQLLLWIAVIGCCTGMAMPIVHIVSHATDIGIPAKQAAQLLSVLFGAGIVSRIGFGLLADRIGAMPTLLIGSLCQGTMLLVFAAVDTHAGLFVAALLFGFGFSGIMPCYALILRQLFPARQAGWRIGAQYMFGALGMALGGGLGGIIYDITGGYMLAFLIGFAFNLVNLIAVGLLFARTPPQRRVLATTGSAG